MGRCGGRRGTVFAILSGEKEGVSSFQLLGKDCDSRLLLFFPQISRVVKAYYEQMYIGTPQRAATMIQQNSPMSNKQPVSVSHIAA